MAGKNSKITVLDPRGQPSGIFGRSLDPENVWAIHDPVNQPRDTAEALAALKMALRLDSLEGKTVYLANTGYNTNEKTIEFMRYHYSFGIDPVELAKILKKGIENEQLYIITVPDPEKMMRDITERMVNYCTPEGMKRQEELMKKRMEEMSKNPMPGLEGTAEAGWGGARPDLTWVKERRRPG